MKRKRLLAFLLAFCMCISQIVTVSATDAETVVQEEVTVQTESTDTEDADTTEETGAEETAATEATETVDAAEETVEETTTETAGETTDDTTAVEEIADVVNVDGTTTEAVSASVTASTTTEESVVMTASLNEEDTSTQYSEDFEGDDASSLWGMSGSLIDEGKLVLATADSNSYITLTGEKLSQRTATKTFDGVPVLASATFSYDIYPVNQTTDSRVGRPGIQLMSNGVEIVSVYTGEMRGATSTSVYYSVYGGSITDTGVTISAGAWSNITINVDYSAYTAEILVNGSVVATVSINQAAYTLDSFVISMSSTNNLGSGKTYTPEIRYDNFSFSYTASDNEIPRYVASVNAIETVTLSKTEYETYTQPDSVTVNLPTGETATLAVTDWTVDTEIDLDDLGTYTWTGQLVMSDDITNPLGLTASYTMEYMADYISSDIYSLGTIEAVDVTLEDWVADYTHPTEVEATLADGSTITVQIDADTWACETFDMDDPSSNKVGTYTWTADIIATETNANPKDLKVSYVMNWYGSTVSEHDYENDFTFDVWESTPFGKTLDQTSGTGFLTISQEQETSADGTVNYYLYATVSNAGGSRGTRMDFEDTIVKGATISFDWMPISVTSVGSGNIDFFSPANNQNYFTLRFDSDYGIYYFTEGDYDNTDVQPAFEGSISEDNKVYTGLGEQGKWFSVSITFDYINHTAELTIYEKDNPDNCYSATVPIEGSANGLSILVLRLDRYSNSRSGVDMGLDNVILDYERFDENDIVSVADLDDVSVDQTVFDEFEWPTEVEVTLGDGSTDTVSVGTWSCAEFTNDGTYGIYTWTAPLVTDKYTNYFELVASFDMTYTGKPYVTYAPNPNTLELEYGTAWDTDQLPTSVTAYLSNGETYELPVSGWVAIRAFNPEEEGIYVYGVNLEGVEGEVDVIDELLTSNEYHVAGDDADLYVYDVYYRISYYDTEDSYYDTYTYSAELLDRGVYAVQSESGEGILVSWRLLVDEYGTDIEFYVYRNGELITEEPITDVTNYLDTEGSVGDVYTIKTVQDGYYWISDAYVATAENYLSITLQNPGPQADINGNLATYTINDCGTADVDGDGELEIIVKWYPSDAFDSGKQDGPSAPTIFDVYEMDGTALWRLNMGLDCPSGAHWNQFMLYDLDEDGCAELFIKTSDGTTSYKPNEDGLFDMTDESTIIYVMGSAEGTAENAGTHILSTGHVSADANEWMTVYDGATGELVCYTDYIYETTDPSDYGDNWYNRASRYNIAIAYQPVDRTNESAGTIPTVLFNHGYYAKTTVAAYTLRTAADGSKYLQLEWGFDSSDYPDEAYTGKGNHNVATGDVDNDGFDELVLGAICLDHDGNVLWVKDGSDGQDVAGHSDALSLAAMNPDDPTQLYVFTPMEEVGTATLSGNLSNAGTGARINGVWYGSDNDIGRGLAANITPTPGYEYWASIPANEGVLSGGIYNFTTGLLTNSRPDNMKTNFIVYWDGDLLSELLDSDSTEGPATVYKYDWVDNELDTLQIMDGTKLNNSTKNNPSLTADLLGDWREEIVVRGEDNETLYIYMTNYETDYAIYSLMYDPVYRNAVANQNTSYNQPPHLGFYLGEDNADQVLSMSLPTANISYTTAKTAGTPVETTDTGSTDTGSTDTGSTDTGSTDTGSTTGDSSDSASSGSDSSEDSVNEASTSDTSSADTSVSPTSTSDASTGDAAGNTVLYCVIIMAVAALGAGVLIVYRRRKRFQA